MTRYLKLRYTDIISISYHIVDLKVKRQNRLKVGTEAGANLEHDAEIRRENYRGWYYDHGADVCPSRLRTTAAETPTTDDELPGPSRSFNVRQKCAKREQCYEATH